ncbi:IS21 family transposase [Parageobacillus thermoglucosidasius]|uniref:IS21 family transposase n=1 Tax=Parageobacillus thermoglucosidasius TaxID=1426 RepID=UPI003B66D6E7
MLTMIQQHHIKYLYEYKGMSLRAIAKETGHSFQTIKKYANKEDVHPLPTPRKPKQSKLDPYKAQIDERLEEDRKVPRKQRHTGTRVYRRLLEMYGEEFSVSLRAVQYYVAKKKQEMYQDGEGYLPLEHSPGEAQADFGSFTYQDEKGVEQEGFFLTLSFPYSNASYAQVVPWQNQECLLQGLKQIFEYIGGVPKRIWFDNLSAAVTSIHRNGKRTLTELFQKFALHYNFHMIFVIQIVGMRKVMSKTKWDISGGTSLFPFLLFRISKNIIELYFTVVIKTWTERIIGKENRFKNGLRRTRKHSDGYRRHRLMSTV